MRAIIHSHIQINTNDHLLPSSSLLRHSTLMLTVCTLQTFLWLYPASIDGRPYYCPYYVNSALAHTSRTKSYRNVTLTRNIPSLCMRPPHFQRERSGQGHMGPMTSNQRHIITCKSAANMLTVDFNSVTVGFSNAALWQNLCLGFPKCIQVHRYCHGQDL